MRRAATRSSDKLDVIAARLAIPKQMVIRNRIITVERCDRPGWVCPVTGYEKIRTLEVRWDLSFIVTTTSRQRVNRWQLPPAAHAKYDAIVDGAQPIGTAGATVWVATLDMIVTAKTHDIVLNETSEVLYFSGGVRSGKTYGMDLWWIRSWMRRGGDGRRFYLVGPDLAHAYRMVTKIFFGRAGTKALIPLVPKARTSKGYPVSALAHEIPTGAHGKLAFPWIDGAINEAHHAKGHGASMEGDAIESAAFDEVARTDSPEPFEVLRARVLQSGGQVALAGAPNEEGIWVYQNVVTKFEKQVVLQEKKQIDMISICGLDNPFIDPANFQRFIDGMEDPMTLAQMGWGKWVLDVQYAYVDVWKSEYEHDHLSHSAEAWGFGPDITHEIAVKYFAAPEVDKPADRFQYLFGADQNFIPQSIVIAKVFGKVTDWQTWHLVVVDEIVINGDAEVAAKALRHRAGGNKEDDSPGIYADAVGVIDANSFHSFARKGGVESRTYNAQHFRKAGFRVVAPIRHVKPGEQPTYSNCGIGDSRTVLRNRMRAGRLHINKGKAPQCASMVLRAPNRGKRNSDHNTWIERQVYGLEDGVRYLGWRIWGKQVMLLEQQLLKVLDGSKGSAAV